MVVPHLTKTPLPFDSIKDFQPVATLARTGLFLVVNPQLPANSLQEFIALAKAKPGALNSAAPGGSINQLATEIFNNLAGLKLVHIPFQTPATVLGNVKGGKLKALAISGETPFPDPKVPTFAQAGLPDFDVGCLVAPAGADPAQDPGDEGRAGAAIAQAQHRPAVRRGLAVKDRYKAASYFF